MKRIISILGILAITTCTAFGQFTNSAVAIMVDKNTKKFLDPSIMTSNGVQSATGGYVTGFAIEGANAKITTGSKGFFRVLVTGNIVQWVIRADHAVTVSIDIAKCTASDFPMATSIVASEPITLSGQQCSTNTTLTGWTKNVTAGDYLRYTISSNDSATNLAIEVTINNL